MAIRTTDRDASAFYTTEQLGKTRELTPEGYLLCKDVRVARTGLMIYTQHDLPNLEPGPDGFIRVTRDTESLFNPITLASFEGKPVTNDHPPEDVTPDNWREYAAGTMHNVRRGDGIDDGYIIADLLVTEGDSIQAVRDGKREISLGYDADYQQTQPGHARQTSIIGNHGALVERGRCGPRCSINDKETSTMSKPTMKDRIKGAFLTRDEKALDAALADVADGGDATGTHIHVHTTDKATKDDAPQPLEVRMDKIEKTLDSISKAILKTKDADEDDEKDEKDKKKTEDADGDEDEKDKDKKKTEDDMFEEEDEDDDVKTTDAAANLRNLISHAEIIVPGFKLPTLTKDAKSSNRKTRDAICACKRRVLDKALKSDNAAMVKKLLNGRTTDKLSADAIDAVFSGSVELIRAANNSKATSTHDADKTKTADAWSKGGINNINKNFWATQGSK